RPLAIDPDVETYARVRTAAAARLQVLVDAHHALGRRLVEAETELERPPFTFAGTRGDLAGEAGLVAFAREDAASGGQRLARRQIGGGKIGRHLAVHALNEVLLHFMKLGR